MEIIDVERSTSPEEVLATLAVNKNIRARIQVTGMSCSSCVSKIEKRVSQKKGITFIVRGIVLFIVIFTIIRMNSYAH